jgi:hypothetical protein
MAPRRFAAHKRRSDDEVMTKPGRHRPNLGAHPEPMTRFRGADRVSPPHNIVMHRTRAFLYFEPPSPEQPADQNPSAQSNSRFGRLRLSLPNSSLRNVAQKNLPATAAVIASRNTQHAIAHQPLLQTIFATVRPTRLLTVIHVEQTSSCNIEMRNAHARNAESKTHSNEL